MGSRADRRQSTAPNNNHSTLTGMQDGIEALADKALEKFEWIETAWRERQGGGDGAD